MSVTSFKQLKDNAISTTVTTMTGTGVTSIVANAGDGVKFPTPGNGFILTLWNGLDPTTDANMEKVVCTARSTDTFTIGATTQTHTAPCNMAILDVSQNLTDLQTAINNLESGANVTIVTLASPLATSQGGTGSATQNFVDLTTGQTIAGSKIFSSPLSAQLTNASALSISQAGSNPAFQVSTSATGTGIKVTAAAAASGAALSVISSGTNENLKIDALGTGTVTINGTASGAVILPSSTTIGGGAALLVTTTSASATAFQIGPNGGTNPTFLINTATASAATGLSITSAAAGSNVTLNVLSSGSNEGLVITSKGTGAVRVTPGSDSSNTFQVTNAANSKSNFFVNNNAGAGFTLPTTIIVNNSAAFGVGQAGTNYGLKIDTTATTAVTGINIKMAAAAAGVAIQTTSTGTNENITLDGKGTGTVTINVGTTQSAGGSLNGGIQFTSALTGIYAGTGAPTFAAAKGSIYTNTTASTTITRVYVNTDGSTTWAAFTASA